MKKKKWKTHMVQHTRLSKILPPCVRFEFFSPMFPVSNSICRKGSILFLYAWVCTCEFKCIHFTDKIIVYTAVNNWMSICDWPSSESIKRARRIYIVVSFDVFMATAGAVSKLILRYKLNYWLFRIFWKFRYR